MKVRDPLASSGQLTFEELYQQSVQTEEQVKAGMHEYRYSSIMDYFAKFNSDAKGIGKYDEAALLFAHAGYVEVFDNASTSAKVALRQRLSANPRNERLYSADGYCRSRYESVPNLAYAPLVEQWHYSSLWNLLGRTTGLSTRRYRKWTEMKHEQDAATDACLKSVTAGGTVEEFNEKQDGARDLEVPYLFCGDEYTDATVGCHVFDQGADPMEIVDSVISGYKNYYFFNNYKRDRFEFDSMSYYARVAGRYFNYLPNVYQHWLFRVGSYGLDDTTQEAYWTVGAWKGINLLLEVISKPQYGTYCKGTNSGSTATCNPSGKQWVLASAGTAPTKEPNSLVIERGDGRRRFSRFDFESGYFYQNKISEVGHFWDFQAALQALTESTGVFVGVETGTDFTRFLVPYYLVFDQELTRFFEGIVTGDYATFGPRVVDGKMVTPPGVVLELNDGRKLDPATGQEVSSLYSAKGEVVDLEAWFTMKFYAALYGMSEFRSTYSLRFNDRLQVFRVGAGEEVTPGPGKQLLTCNDPIGGQVYGTIYDPATADADQGSNVKTIKECQKWAEAYKNATPDSTPQRMALYKLNDTVEWLNVMRALYGALGTVL